ncbi:Ribosomal protein S18 acetylase RimI [Abditibacterium utsteinense]|uniref:Ribosomal protein S18 acetylase RimI n=1 Tax=Abditibacterium utsteinense TaxID=1960156 RepID=A0A2S8SRK7_9BACT|nr:GNAT family N-acetyltransferase [Abditibacterium utsteinense]PQV63430.1 Ribosomal protein S18 acetylase RimI [Abditibacterium utsteinense]
MNSPIENSLETHVQMARPHLNNWAASSLPAGFSIRVYQSGDEVNWRAIQERADPFNSFDDTTFATWFGDDEAVLRARQRYLLAPDGQVIGTATAWFDNSQTGRVHWVAIVPEYQGRRLARPLLWVIGQTLRELGHTSAVLTTSIERPVAIALYRTLGFEIVK